jgi:hypothetical protein
MTILTSPTLTEFETKCDHHKSQSKSVCDEFRRVTKLQREDFLDHTSVTRMMDVSKRTISEPPENLAGRTTGTTVEADAKRRQDDLERTLRGEPLAERTDTKARLDELNRRAQAEESAINFLEKQIAAEKYKLAVEHCRALKPKEAKIMAALYKALADVHSAHCDLNDMRQTLIDDGIGLRGICLNMPDFLDNPRNKNSNLAEYFHEGHKNGFINANVIPKAFQA